MSWSITPTLGTLNLSGTTYISFDSENNVVEHIIPGLSYRPVERIGRKVDRVSMRGFFWSGSDAMKDTLIGMIGSGQTLTIPSSFSGNYFFSGTITFDKLLLSQVAGRQYPYYEWAIANARIVTSGKAVITTFSGAVTGSGYRTIPIQQTTDTGHFAAFGAAGRWWVFVNQVGGNGDAMWFTAQAVASPTWLSGQVMSGNASDIYDVWWDGTYFHYMNNPVFPFILYRRGLPNSDGTVTWSANPQSVPATSGVAGREIYMAVDVSGYPTLSYSDSISSDRVAERANTNDGTWTSDSLFQPPAGGPGFGRAGGPLTSPGITALTNQRMALGIGNQGSAGSGLFVYIASGTGGSTGFYTSGAFISMASGQAPTNTAALGIGDDQLWFVSDQSGAVYTTYYTFNTSSLTTMIMVSGINMVKQSYTISYDDTKSKVYLFYVVSGGSKINYVKYDIASNTWNTTPILFATAGTGETIVASGVTGYRQEISGQIGVTWTSKSGAGLFVSFATFAV